MNNRGFASTGMLYIVLLLFLAMYTSLLIMFANRRKIYDNIKDEIVNGVSNVDEPIYNLIDVVSVGDYVAYDAGVWEETKERPTAQGEFGGYTLGTSKSDTVEWCYNSQYTSIYKGWRVLKIENNNVFLIHAGVSECYYHASQNNSSSILALNNRANIYLNDIYADNSYILTRNEAVAITLSENATTNDLRYLGLIDTNDKSELYWLADEYSHTSLYCVGRSGNTVCGMNNVSLGIRPVIVLKQGLKTNGKVIDIVGNEAWNLIAS